MYLLDTTNDFTHQALTPLRLFLFLFLFPPSCFFLKFRRNL